MKNYFLLLIAIFVTILCCSCSKNLTNESSFDIVNAEDFSFTVIGISNSQINVEISNKLTSNLYWDSWFCLEKKYNDKWYEVKEKELEENYRYVLSSDLRYIEPDEIVEFEIDLHSYENLYSGNYRIIKEFFFDERSQEEKIYVACEFYIE